MAKYNILLNIQSKVDEAVKDTKELKKGFTGANKQVDRYTSLAKKAFAVGTIIAAAKATQLLVNQSINLAAGFEDSSNNLVTLTGSLRNAEKLLDDIDRRSIPTPFSPDAFKEATIQLLNYGVSQENVLDDIDRIGELSGGSEQKLLALADAYGKAKARVKVTNETLELFANNGVPILDVLAKKLKTTKEEIIDMASKGKINFDMLRSAIKDVADEGGKFDGSLTRASKSLNGLRSTLSGLRDRFARLIGTKFLDQAKSVVSFFIDLTNAATKFIEVPFEDHKYISAIYFDHS